MKTNPISANLPSLVLRSRLGVFLFKGTKMKKPYDPSKRVDLRMLKKFIGHLSLSELFPIRKLLNHAISEKRKNFTFPLPDIQVTGNFKKPSVALLSLLNDDWEYLFEEYDNVKKGYCVYLHTEPHKDGVYFLNYEFGDEGRYVLPTPFYIGQGFPSRPYNFKSRSKLHKRKLHELLDQGFDNEDIAYVIESDLTERKAREMESKLILFFGCATGENFNVLSRNKNQQGILINHQYEPFPDFYKRYTQYKNKKTCSYALHDNDKGNQHE